MYRNSIENNQFGWLFQTKIVQLQIHRPYKTRETANLNSSRLNIYRQQHCCAHIASDNFKRSVIVRKLLQIHGNRCGSYPIYCLLSATIVEFEIVGKKGAAPLALEHSVVLALHTYMDVVFSFVPTFVNAFHTVEY